MTYHSTAARIRIRQRNNRIRIRNRFVFWIGIIGFGVIGLWLGFKIIELTMPSHPWFN